MAPVSNCPQWLFLFLSVAALAACANAISSNVTSNEPSGWGLHQICTWPRVTTCNNSTSIGYIEDEIRTYYDSWDKGDIRREYINLQFFLTPPEQSETDLAEYNDKLSGWLAPIYDRMTELFHEEKEAQEENPELIPEPYKEPGFPKGAKDHITIADICCPVQYPCMASRNFEDAFYCYNSNLTSFLLTEVYTDPRVNAGIVNIKDFKYTRRDGEVFTFLPESLLPSTSATSDIVTKVRSTPTTVFTTTKSTSTATVTSVVTLHSTVTETVVNYTTTQTIQPTESGSAGSTIVSNPGAMSVVMAMIGSLVFTGLGAILVL